MGTSSQNDFHFPEHQDSPHHRTAPYPKLEFPKFDGDNPRLWRDRCQMYFEVYAVADALKTRFAALNFLGAAATWLQTIERKERILDWDHFCSLVFTRFDKNQYQLQLRQLDSLKQTGSAQEYQERFEQLSHGILLYNAAYDETYFITRFLGGLREDIRAPIALHRPKDVDTASALALLQEEELENVKKKTVQKGDSKDFSKFGQKWTAEKFKATPRKEESTKVEKAPFDEKLSALKAFRKANGLCFKCGDKWGQNHKCPKQISLHVLEEFLEVFELHDIQVSESDGEDNSGSEGVCAVEQSPLQATQRFRTLKLLGRIGKYHLLFLIDSGSIGTFVSDKLVSRLQLPTGYSFTSDARVLPLRCYDMILGEDWLESCSPMWVDWKLKQMTFTVAGQKVALQGITDDVTNCSAISVHKLKGLDFEHLFANPTSLPPHRQADHMIPLLPGSQPIKIRPYRYSPVQKDEIEAQLKEMLNQGVIRHSSSSFASPVLLVKKKDGSWRLCVDYRHLNALIEKNKHPMPVVDELLDELAGAQWFSKLDFRSGCHQIRMAPGEEYKTTFCTHSGLYEFLVMPFGLTNAPATFQSLMNHIFARLLRKGVLVFMDDILIYSKSLQEHVVLLKQVFEILQENQFLIKWSKCSFAQSSIEYLGHVISKDGVATEPSKITAIKNWPVPTCLKELRGILGLTGYYRKFIKHYSMISRPLTMLLKKGVKFVWTAHSQEAFQILKQALVQAPVLAIPDFQQTFVLETDANDCGVGAVLMQAGHPVAYLSKALSPKNQTLYVYEKECLAILLAVEKWRKLLAASRVYALGRSPFEVLYGHSPRQLGITNLQECSVPDLEQWLKERGFLTKLIQQHLARAQHRMKQQAYKKRSERSFAVGDKVYLKLQPYVQSSVAYRSNHKLSFRYYGPFLILEKIGEVAYRLDLPPDAKIHPVVHVSQLKLRIAPTTEVQSDLAIVCIDPFACMIPEAILERKQAPRGNSVVSQVLVRWTSLPDSMATWDEEIDLRRRYPKAPAWGQAGIQGEGYVTKGSISG
ncbi:hypothetical protein U9M48_011733 [Paspalum notatum var. saurae]|uniref:Reverse transcriptase domain-containing protein n=1 Tax=Paspalum notatum var. saurae TaxID=547442 RepID=A0AAQ3WHD0_PASNO